MCCSVEPTESLDVQAWWMDRLAASRMTSGVAGGKKRWSTTTNPDTKSQRIITGI
jgi:hypothetical protein